MPQKTFVSDITGGTKPRDRTIGDNLTIQDIWDVYRWFPGFKGMLKLKVKAIWSNGISSENILPDRLLELKDGHEWCFMVGYGVFIVDARRDPPTVEFWHPEVDGIGFKYTDFSKQGYPLKIEVHMKSGETEASNINFPVPAYPCEMDNDGEYIRDRPIPGQYGFFSIRNRSGLRGVQGLPEYLDLIDPFRSQFDILKYYIPFAMKQGMSFPKIKLKHLNATTRASVTTQMAAKPTSNRLLIIGDEDDAEWVSPMEHAYDPTMILEWIDRLIARDTQMNKLMLEGDPGGHLSASETAINNWEIGIKEDQIFWRTQFLPIWVALGAEDDTEFKDPSKPTFISLMEGLKAMREAFDGIVDREDIVKQYNEYLEKHGHKTELKVAPKEELNEFNQFGQNSQQQGNNQGNQTDKDKTNK